MNNFLELITIPMAANDAKSFELSGDYFEIIEAQYPVTVILSDRNGVQTGRMSNAEQSFYIKNTGFGNIQILTTNAQTVRIGYGSGEAGTRRTAGIVSVVDGGRARTNAKLAFMGGITIAPGAGNYAVVQLFNPVGSGKNLVLSGVIGQVSNADGLAYFIQNASIGGTVTAPTSKLGGGTASLGEIRRIGTPTIFSTGQIFGCNLPASGFIDHKFTEPLVLPPGYGLTSQCSTLNNAGGSSFEYYEETI